MYCSQCGKQVADGTKYCIYCGAPLHNTREDEKNGGDTAPAEVPVHNMQEEEQSEPVKTEYVKKVPEPVRTEHVKEEPEPVRTEHVKEEPEPVRTEYVKEEPDQAEFIKPDLKKSEPEPTRTEQEKPGPEPVRTEPVKPEPVKSWTDQGNTGTPVNTDGTGKAEYAGRPDQKSSSSGRKKVLIPVIIAAVCAAVIIAVFIVRRNSGAEANVSEPYIENTDDAADTEPEQEEEFSLSFLTDSLVLENQGDVKGISLNTDIEDLSEIKWVSEDETIASVDENGYVTAVSAGETYVTASWNGLYASCRVICDFEESASDGSTGEDLQLNANTAADYSANLNPDEYLYYSSPEFSFGYPSQLYCDGWVNTDQTETSVGRNLRQVYLSGDDSASEAMFQAAERTDSLSAADFMQSLYSYYYNLLQGANQISYSETSGRFILTGYTDSSSKIAVYLLVTVESRRVYIMHITFPDTGDTSSEDYQQKAYVVENMYRMCSFSGSSYYPRTYEQYLSGERGDQK